MEREKLKFKIRLYSTYWDKPPIAEIKLIKTSDKVTTDVDNKNLFDYNSNKPILNTENSYFKEEITNLKEDAFTITFEHELEHGVSYDLVIKRSNKDKGQTVVEGGKIVKDQSLHIGEITIDEIDIGALVYEGIYRPEYAEPWASQQAKAGIKLPETLKNVTEMGHNGTWTFTFNSPFYMWLLENLY
jgi:hypothetical protein